MIIVPERRMEHEYPAKFIISFAPEYSYIYNELKLGGFFLLVKMEIRDGMFWRSNFIVIVWRLLR